MTSELIDNKLIGDSSTLPGKSIAPKAHRNKRQGYKLWKEGYVRNVLVKPNIQGRHRLFLVKSKVHVSLKSVFYNVYAYLDQDNGEILYAKCNCKAGQGGCCKHVAALLYTLLDCTSMELKKIPDTMTCTQIAQKWHVPSAANMTLCKAVKFSEVAFEKAEPNKTRKRPTVSGMREDFCATPPFAYRMSSEALQTLVKDLRHLGKAELFCKALASNEFEPSTQFETSCRKKELAKTTTSDSSLAQSSAGGQDVIENIFKNIGNAVFDAEDMPDVETGQKVQKLVGISVEDANVLCRNTVKQSEEASWYDERSKRLTSSNFGRIIKRKKNIA
eukprot:gene20962-23017_t